MALLTALTFLLMLVLVVNAGHHNNNPHNAGDHTCNNNPYNFTFLADPGVFGPPLEVVHAYFGEWPDGIAVSSTGRLFSSFPGLDPGNVNNGTPGIFTVGELTSPSTEKAYPSVEINTPPCSGGAVDLADPQNPVGCGSADHLISAQSVVIDSKDRLWILDTGRPAYIFPNGSLILLPSSYGGPKLVAVDLSTNTIFKTILFPPEVALPEDSYLNDVRFDLRPNLTSSGDGVAYITDASLTGQNAIIVVDLGTGDSWRRLQGNPSVLPVPKFLPFVWGQPLYFVPDPGHPPTGNLTTTPPPAFLPVGSDGIAISADGETLFYTPLASRNLYSVPTSLLRQRDDAVESELAAAVIDYGQTGFSDGMETDSNGLIYKGNQEANAVLAFDPKTGTTQTVVRDPRIGVPLLDGAGKIEA
ncbi:hypothetical protein N0V85_007968 [Neurospora sp. IMI 360204]|nr:hypothetical protein N0V85_007968 [Neurospora sp. IMI 360204]